MLETPLIRANLKKKTKKKQVAFFDCSYEKNHSSFLIYAGTPIAHHERRGKLGCAIATASELVLLHVPVPAVEQAP